MTTRGADSSIRDVEPPSIRRLLVAVGLTAWIVAIGYGMAALARYESAAGEANSHAIVWPEESQVTPNTNRPTMVLFVHPHCPCTRATIGELERIVARCPGRAEIHVLFIEPGDVLEGWSDSDLQVRVRAIPGVNVLIDRHGREANLFGAATSGQLLLYDERKQLRFSGGITALRGHFGDNIGTDNVVSLLTGDTRPSGRICCAVFGCPLFHSDGETGNDIEQSLNVL